MPQLIKNIQSSLKTYFIGNVYCITNIIGQIQQEDYINLRGYTAYLQNLMQTEDTQSIISPLSYGLKNLDNIDMLTLQIDY
jgi:hypothetical protein